MGKSKYSRSNQHGESRNFTRLRRLVLYSCNQHYNIYFRGQIETPAKSLGSLVINEDTEVLVAINNSGLYVLDPVRTGVF